MLKRLSYTTINIILILILLCGAVSQNKKIFGVKYDSIPLLNKNNIKKDAPTHSELNQVGFGNLKPIRKEKGIYTLQDKKGNTKSTVINSAPYCNNIIGYAGPIPMLIFIDNENKITHIIIKKNNEDVPYMKRVVEDGIVKQWIGKDYQETIGFHPDAVSGATMSSNAINRSVVKCMEIYSNIENSDSEKFTINWNVKTLLMLIVLFFAVFASFYYKKNTYIRTILLILNIGVLGFWCASFISLNFLLGMVENGIHFQNNLIIYIMIFLAIIMPVFFKKKSFYCTWICPFGAAQELAGKINKNKWVIPPKIIKYIKHSRKIITIALLVLMWCGVTTKIAGYEPFSAFMFSIAILPVIITAICSIVLSIFISKPWCRFFCPTGQILKWTEKVFERNHKKKSTN